ncbi:unnamed protein product [Tetraodon nigroviridis]|uniref:Chromosome 9 SCAF14991, whole genome shotgun sequence n=1 Tax=Tetraodon nigroviridis TaxID=99883 RepID=Q4RW10_TETNG|nr:unnamed protein product [Tetraodon nigroviridis]
MATASYDPHLGAGPSEDSEILLDDSDSGSLISEDSLFPDYESEDKNADPAKTLYEACIRNDPTALCRILERGITKEEAMELDINGRNGLMVAVSKGFIDIVTTLHVCPLIEINHQDNDGNTALMIAAQAGVCAVLHHRASHPNRLTWRTVFDVGFVNILNYIINFYAGVDTEVRDPRGFTALIKAGLQGREECVAALLMHGADINAMDLVKGRNLKDWVLKTGGFETFKRVRRLQARPIGEQFCMSYVPEWPDLKQLVAKATATKTATQKLRQRLKDGFSFSFPHDPEDNGVMDHMVRMTTSIHSPLIATGCHPLCPSSPPEIGKQRFAVPELLEKYSCKEAEESTVSHNKGSVTSASPTAVSATSVSLTSCCQNSGHRDSTAGSGGGGMRGLMPRSVAHRNSIFPSGCIPKIEVTKSSGPTPKKEKKKKRQKGYLEPPVWKFIFTTVMICEELTTKCRQLSTGESQEENETFSEKQEKRSENRFRPEKSPTGTIQGGTKLCY